MSKAKVQVGVLGLALGLRTEDHLRAGECKHVAWSRHPIGLLLHEMLDRLAQEGLLLRREEPDLAYRRNPDYRGSWESA